MNDSKNSSPIVVIVIICAALLLLCMAVPIGAGAIMYFRFQHEAQAAQAAAMAAERDALAAQQAALAAQAEASRQAAEQMRLANEQMAKALAVPPQLSPPGIGELPLETRKLIYQQLKQAQSQLAELEKLATDDPALAEAFAAAKTQQPAILEQAMRAMNISREQLDAIMAEGDKEKW